MELTQKLALSYYKTIAVLNESHHIYLVQHQTTQKIYVKKILNVYQKAVYEHLLEHPISGIPRIWQMYEEEEERRLILIEDYVSGTSLDEYIQSQAFTTEDALSWMLQLCSILERLHSQEPAVIHRDIKPSNIIITTCGSVVLLDFNAAKFEVLTSTRDTTMIGTQGYAAPEQYGFGASTTRTDIYAFGMVLQELVNALIQPDSRYDAVIKTCTHLEPSLRYGSMLEVKKELLRIKDPEGAESAAIPVKRSATLPGYRSGKNWKKVLATAGYLLLLYLFFTLEIEGVTGAALWLERSFLTGFLLLIVFTCTDYLHMRRIIPFAEHNNFLIRFLAIVCFDTVAIFGLLVLMLMIEEQMLHLP